ncbi:MAG: hypothetical protein KDA89_05700 [Planctomycetaceae bacterium]|nr:hypothetical protein [Planctomycetaceae bacterium]
MIYVAEANEPATFDTKVRQPGLRAIAEMVGEQPPRNAGRRFEKVAERREHIPSSRFPTYWTKCLPELETSYGYICAYSCFRIHPVTGAASVDHMAPKSRAWHRVYEWNNYRLACSRLNARKNSFEDVMDPFEIEDGWFQLELVGFTIIPNPQLPRSRQRQIEDTVRRLGLDDFADDRALDAENYWSREITIKILRSESPFVAMELQRQGRLNSGDE